MNRPRSRLVAPLLGLCGLVGLVAAFAGFGAAPPADATATPSKVTTIDVTAGKPSELAFTLSKTSEIPVGTVTFKVTNAGVLAHTFKLCTTPIATASDACTGEATPLIQPGKSATLTVKLTKSGTYEYLCTVPGHAAAGMKGLIGVGVALAASQPTTTVAVALGLPTELAFKLSTVSSIPPGKVIFKVVNAGKTAHSFAVCLTSTASASDACKGKSDATPPLQPSKAATLTVTLTVKGTYEYLSTVPGQAASGMKGLLGVGVKVTPPPATTTTRTTTTTPTTTAAAPPPPPAGGGTTTTVANDGCPPGVTIETSGNTDDDFDEDGQPSDGDGCT